MAAEVAAWLSAPISSRSMFDWSLSETLTRLRSSLKLCSSISLASSCVLSFSNCSLRYASAAPVAPPESSFDRRMYVLTTVDTSRCARAASVSS